MSEPAVVDEKKVEVEEAGEKEQEEEVVEAPARRNGAIKPSPTKPTPASTTNRSSRGKKTVTMWISIRSKKTKKRRRRIKKDTQTQSLELPPIYLVKRAEGCLLWVVVIGVQQVKGYRHLKPMDAQEKAAKSPPGFVLNAQWNDPIAIHKEVFGYLKASPFSRLILLWNVSQWAEDRFPSRHKPRTTRLNRSESNTTTAAQRVTRAQRATLSKSIILDEVDVQTSKELELDHLNKALLTVKPFNLVRCWRHRFLQYRSPAQALGINDLPEFVFMDLLSTIMIFRAMQKLHTLQAQDDVGLLTRMGRRMVDLLMDSTLTKLH
ncbi:hypothetical protein EJ08DRAFT_664957 [Tothia fuscella]|uniref:Uncharacterized protein n=1 Tax=Tothia fuscella TaxID=1048955 RepID=A0A9P4TTB1_9PEZI|nr:hypothetical protein EJ08DRAFT_664957 [Tothia fuscella]